MILVYVKNIIIFISAVLLQGLLFDNITLGGYLNPYFYVIFILLLPFETPKWTLLFSSFFLGLSVDLFNNTYGMHAAASVFMAYLRPFSLKAFSPKDNYEKGSNPRVYYYGLDWFLKYSVLLIFAHHFLLFTIEVFRFAEFLHTSIRIVSSTILTSFIVLISQYFIFRK